jgi:hypothetical protein
MNPFRLPLVALALAFVCLIVSATVTAAEQNTRQQTTTQPQAWPWNPQPAPTPAPHPTPNPTPAPAPPVVNPDPQQAPQQAPGKQVQACNTGGYYYSQGPMYQQGQGPGVYGGPGIPVVRGVRARAQNRRANRGGLFRGLFGGC